MQPDHPTYKDHSVAVDRRVQRAQVILRHSYFTLQSFHNIVLLSVLHILSYGFYSDVKTIWETPPSAQSQPLQSVIPRLISDTSVCVINHCLVNIKVDGHLSHTSQRCVRLFHPNTKLHIKFTKGLPCPWVLGQQMIFSGLTWFKKPVSTAKFGGKRV